jgi:hypothetical protein
VQLRDRIFITVQNSPPSIQYPPTVADKLERSTFLTVQYSQFYLYTVDARSERTFLTVQGRVVLVSKSAGARSRLPTQTSGKKPAANCLQEDRNPLRQLHEANSRDGGKTVHVVFQYICPEVSEIVFIVGYWWSIPRH